MLLDFEVQRCTRRCATTQRALEAGEVCYSALYVEGSEVLRRDFAQDSWNGPPSEAFAWWKSRIPENSAKKVKLAPNEVLIELFDQLADQPDQQDMRYVLALLLVRRRVLRVDTTIEFQGAERSDLAHAPAVETLNVYCPKRDASYEVPAVMPNEARIDEIQNHLSDLLTAGAD